MNLHLSWSRMMIGRMIAPAARMMSALYRPKFRKRRFQMIDDTENNTLPSRLRQHYVAMTRPSHLVCLAMRESCWTNADVAALKNRGWRVARVNAGVPEWW